MFVSCTHATMYSYAHAPMALFNGLDQTTPNLEPFHEDSSEYSEYTSLNRGLYSVLNMETFIHFCQPNTVYDYMYIIL